MRQVRTLEDIMAFLDQRLKALKISRSATQNFPGIKSEVVNGWFANRSRDMSTKILMALWAGVGVEVWLRPIPRTAAERLKYEADFADWMAQGGIKLEDDSEVRMPQTAPPGRELARVGRGAKPRS